VLDVGELVAKCGREFGSGDEVVAGLVLLTELPDVAAAQEAQPSPRPVIGCPKDPDRQTVAATSPT